MVNCRICKGKLVRIINLGKISLVGNFIRKFKKQKKYKISLNFCVKCKHVQIAEILNPNLLFKKYLWETGVSKSNIKLIEDIIKKIKKYGISSKSKILEIASNDGSFLSLINKKYKCLAVGIDPATNFKKNQIKEIYSQLQIILILINLRALKKNLRPLTIYLLEMYLHMSQIQIKFLRV